MNPTLVSILLLVAILGGSAIITQLFARAMYLTCPHCRTLNARRRTNCRKCGGELRRHIPSDGAN